MILGMDIDIDIWIIMILLSIQDIDNNIDNIDKQIMIG